MSAPEQEYIVTMTISPFERKVIQHLRALRAAGYGQLFIQYVNGTARKCSRTFDDNPDELAQLQEPTKAGTSTIKT